MYFMNIWVTEIGEPLPIEGDSRLLRYGVLTKSLVGYGHEVVWWTSNFSHAAKKHICDGDIEIYIDGVLLKILKGPGYKRNISYRRIKHQRRFAERFYQLSNESKAPDLIISSIPTLEVATRAIHFGKKHNVPVLVDIRDEWPDEFVDLAPRCLKWLARLVFSSSYRRMEYICKNATGILAMSQRQLNYGLSFANRQQTKTDRVFPHGYCLKPVDEKKMNDAEKWWKKVGVNEGAFLCCFFGKVGNFFNLDTVIKAADILSKEFNIQFVLCGDGSRLGRYKKLASDVNSVIFPGWVDAPKIAALMKLSDVGLAPYSTNTRMSLPNKVFEYFAGGIPVVSSIQGEITHFLKEYHCGITYDPNSVESLCNAIRQLHASEDLRKSMGRNGRKLLEERFTTEYIFKEFNEHIITVVEDFENLTRGM